MILFVVEKVCYFCGGLEFMHGKNPLERRIEFKLNFFGFQIRMFCFF